MIRQLTVSELKARLEKGSDDFVVIDVREPWEIAVCSLLGAVSIPMRAIPARYPELSKDTELVLMCHHGVRNITLETGDGARGWDRQQPYDAIIITGSLPILPEAFRQSLAPGGRLIAIVGQSPAMEVLRVRRVDATVFREDSLFETDLPPLRNAIEPAKFIF